MVVTDLDTTPGGQKGDQEQQGVNRDAAHFGADRVFMDVQGIEPGVDFVEAIERALVSCEILIVLIGKDWLATDAAGRRRLDDPADFVRLETANVDHMPGLSNHEKKDRLSRISYKDFLLIFVKVHPDVIPFYQTRTHGLYGVDYKVKDDITVQDFMFRERTVVEAEWKLIDDNLRRHGIEQVQGSA